MLSTCPREYNARHLERRVASRCSRTVCTVDYAVRSSSSDFISSKSVRNSFERHTFEDPSSIAAQGLRGQICNEDSSRTSFLFLCYHNCSRQTICKCFCSRNGWLRSCARERIAIENFQFPMRRRERCCRRIHARAIKALFLSKLMCRLRQCCFLHFRFKKLRERLLV